MAKPNVYSVPLLPQFQVEHYRKYLPSAYDDSLTIYDQLVNMIAYLRETANIVNDVVEQWNIIREWIVNEGLNDAVVKQLDEWVKDGTMDQILNDQLFGDFFTRVENMRQEFIQRTNQLTQIRIFARYDTVEKLQFDYPNGRSDLAIVGTDTTQWYYYQYGVGGAQGEWKAGGVFPAINITNNSILTQFFSKETGILTVSNTLYGNIKREKLFTNIQGENLFDFRTIRSGFYVIDGKFTPTQSGSTTDFIPIKKNSQITSANFLGGTGIKGCLFDESLKFIKNIELLPDGDNQYFETGQASYYVQNIGGVTNIGQISSSFCINYGKTPKRLSSYGYGEIETLTPRMKNSLDRVGLEQMSTIEIKNIYADSESEQKKYIANNGAVGESEIINLSRPYRVYKGDVIRVSNVFQQQGGAFGLDMKWYEPIIIENGIYTIKKDGYIRVNCVRTYIDTFKVSINTELGTGSGIEIKFPNAGSGERGRQLKVLCIGDSLTWLDGQTVEGVGKITGYQNVLRNAGYDVVTRGFSGATMRYYDESTSNRPHDSILEKIEAMSDINKFDIIILFAGTNDVGVGYVPGPVTGTDKKTTCGAFNVGIDLLKKVNGAVFVCSVTKSTLGSRPETNMKDINDKIKFIANAKQVKFIELYEDPLINVSQDTYDQLHFNNKGFVKVGLSMKRQSI